MSSYSAVHIYCLMYLTFNSFNLNLNFHFILKLSLVRKVLLMHFEFQYPSFLYELI